MGEAAQGVTHGSYTGDLQFIDASCQRLKAVSPGCRVHFAVGLRDTDGCDSNAIAGVSAQLLAVMASELSVEAAPVTK